jgi:type 1 glutamine amidotransferase
MAKSALIVWGGWDGHTPGDTAEVLAGGLREAGFRVRLENSLAPLEDQRALKRLDLIVPVWTMGTLSGDQWKGLNAAVASGVGIGGVHGGMGDAFRGHVSYEWMVGGIFAGHPHVGPYTVRLTDQRSPITRGMKSRFRYNSEQYYMLVDPGNRVLAVTTYRHEGRRCTMPVVWTRTWGRGRVFYSSLGHVAEEFRTYPEVFKMTVRGLVWAADGKASAGRQSKRERT